MAVHTTARAVQVALSLEQYYLSVLTFQINLYNCPKGQRLQPEKEVQNEAIVSPSLS